MIYGFGETKEEALDKYNYIPEGGMNEIIRDWQYQQKDREIKSATPSQITMCPRAVWFLVNGVEKTNDLTWALKQRLLLGRLFENQFAIQLNDMGKLLYHWKDDDGEEVKRFSMGSDNMYIDGVPDFLLSTTYSNQEIVAISDSKTSRGDSFGYVEKEIPEIWEDWGWFKYKMQLTAYYMLCLANKKWFEDNNLPLPTHCHLFSYALDDGLVRRDLVWEPTENDMKLVKFYTERFNQAIHSKTMPECTCKKTKDQFEMKFCRYGIVPDGAKVAESCCSDALANKVKKEGE